MAGYVARYGLSVRFCSGPIGRVAGGTSVRAVGRPESDEPCARERVEKTPEKPPELASVGVHLVLGEKTNTLIHLLQPTDFRRLPGHGAGTLAQPASVTSSVLGIGYIKNALVAGTYQHEKGTLWP